MRPTASPRKAEVVLTHAHTHMHAPHTYTHPHRDLGMLFKKKDSSRRNSKRLLTRGLWTKAREENTEEATVLLGPPPQAQV